VGHQTSAAGIVAIMARGRNKLLTIWCDFFDGMRRFAFDETEIEKGARQECDQPNAR
jgi:hypothetical protein